jgi:hypothetical protein
MHHSSFGNAGGSGAVVSSKDVLCTAGADGKVTMHRTSGGWLWDAASSSAVAGAAAGAKAEAAFALTLDTSASMCLTDVEGTVAASEPAIAADKALTFHGRGCALGHGPQSMATAAAREQLKQQQQQQQHKYQQPAVAAAAAATADVIKQAVDGLIEDVHPKRDGADLLLHSAAGTGLLGGAKWAPQCYLNSPRDPAAWQGGVLQQQQQQLTSEVLAGKQATSVVSPALSPVKPSAAAAAAAAASAGAAVAPIWLSPPLAAADVECLGTAADDAADQEEDAEGEQVVKLQLAGFPREWISRLEDYILVNGLPRSQLRQLLDSWDQAGIVKPLKRCIYRPKSYNHELKAFGCWALGDHQHLTLELPEVWTAVEYTPNEEASFVQQQEDGLGCVRVKVSCKSRSRRVAGGRAVAEGELFAKLDLYAVALLMWRLQRVQDLPLGIFNGMRNNIDAAVQGTASQQQMRSNVRNALNGCGLGSRAT